MKGHQYQSIPQRKIERNSNRETGPLEENHIYTNSLLYIIIRLGIYLGYMLIIFYCIMETRDIPIRIIRSMQLLATKYRKKS